MKKTIVALVLFNVVASALCFFLMLFTKASAGSFPAEEKLRKASIAIEAQPPEKARALLLELLKGADGLTRVWISAADRLAVINLTVSGVNLILLIWCWKLAASGEKRDGV